MFGGKSVTVLVVTLLSKNLSPYLAQLCWSTLQALCKEASLRPFRCTPLGKCWVERVLAELVHHTTLRWSSAKS